MTVSVLDGPLSDWVDELLRKQSSLDTMFGLVNNSGFTLFRSRLHLSSDLHWKRLRNRPFAPFQTRDHQELFMRTLWESWIFQTMLFVWCLWGSKCLQCLSLCESQWGPVSFIVCSVVFNRRQKESHTSLDDTRLNKWWQNDCFWLDCLLSQIHTWGELSVSRNVCL